MLINLCLTSWFCWCRSFVSVHCKIWPIPYERLFVNYRLVTGYWPVEIQKWFYCSLWNALNIGQLFILTRPIKWQLSILMNRYKLTYCNELRSTKRRLLKIWSIHYGTNKIIMCVPFRDRIFCLTANCLYSINRLKKAVAKRKKKENVSWKMRLVFIEEQILIRGMSKWIHWRTRERYKMS